MEKTKAFCIGCENNFYNDNNPYNVKECWSYKSAKLVKKRKVHINQVPPWKQPLKDYLSCYHSKQYIYTEREC